MTPSGSGRFGARLYREGQQPARPLGLDDRLPREPDQGHERHRQGVQHHAVPDVRGCRESLLALILRWHLCSWSELTIYVD